MKTTNAFKYVLTSFIILVAALTSSYGKDDRNTVILTILGESRSEGEDGMRAVAQVIWNRAKANPINFRTVCLKKKQFSFWNTPHKKEFLNKILNSKEGLIAKKVVDQMYLKLEPYPELGKVNFYHEKSITPPYWAINKQGWILKNHIFYYI